MDWLWSCYSNSVAAKGLRAWLKAVRLAPLYCNCKSGRRNRLCLHLNELKARNFQISAGAVIRKIFRKILILYSCWVAEVRSLLTSYFISCCVERHSFLLKQHFCLHMGWNTSAMDDVVIRHLLPLPECWFAARVHEKHELLDDCAAPVWLKASVQHLPWRRVGVFWVHICSASHDICPTAVLHVPCIASAKALGCKQMKISSWLLCVLGVKLSFVLGYIHSWRRSIWSSGQ